MAYPDKIPSILAPQINSIFTGTSNLQQLKPSLIKNSFSKTLSLIQKRSYRDTDLASFITFAKKGKDKKIIQVFACELTKFQLEQLSLDKENSQASIGLLFIKQLLQRKKTQRLLALTDDQLLKQRFRLTKEARIINLETTDTMIYLLKRTPQGVDETIIPAFCANVLQAFSKQITVKTVITKMITYYNAQTNEDKKIIQEKVLQQIKECLRYGLFE